jgi:FlaA1/EpsC-like NDP-sugar epimerase
MAADARTSQPGVGTGATWRVRAIAIGGVTLATVVIWLVARALEVDFKVDQRNGQPPVDVTLPSVIAVTLIVSLLAWGTLALLQRFTSRGTAIWTVLAVVVLLLSYLLLVFAGATAGTKITLFLMHSSVAAVLIPVMRRGAPHAR